MVRLILSIGFSCFEKCPAMVFVKSGLESLFFFLVCDFSNDVVP